jgi:hypothetical protein
MGLQSNINLTQVYDLTKQLADLYKSLLVANNAVATGKLKDFTTAVQVSETELKIIYNLPFYWQWLEDGRPPTTRHNPPPLQPSILDWIREKGITPKAGKNGKIPTQTQLSWAITRKIHKDGYRGRPMLKESLQSGKPIINQITNIVADAVGLKEIQPDLIHVFDGMKT